MTNLFLDENGFVTTQKPKLAKTALAVLLRNVKPVEFLTDEELNNLPAGDVFVFDTECYSNFWYCAFKHLGTGKYVAFERSPAKDFFPLKLSWMLWTFCIVGFNSRNYDIPMIAYAISGASCAQLKKASDAIIQDDLRAYNFEKEYKVNIPNVNHIDLIEVAPLQGSLKIYTARLHCQRMQDLPIDPNAILTAEDADIIRPYCCNDLDNTELLFNQLAPELQLRMEMTQEYGIDLRSKSDAQVAEAVINSELQKVLGFYPKKPTLSAGTVLRYTVPDFVCFQTAQLQGALQAIAGAEFELDALGSPIMPAALDDLTVTIGKSTYKLGMGGLHSSEKCIAHVASEDIILADNDVESFYPRTILNQRLFPPHLGEAFLKVYDKIVQTRLDAKEGAKKAKEAGDKQAAKRWKTIADSLKITINGSFGKLGNKYSTLYAPQLMLQVTITGQLVLLMLIEALEGIGIEVVSGNTDGIVSKYHKSRHEEVRQVITMWERHTGYKTEETRYLATYSRDVNNYIALKEKGDPEARYLDEQLGCKTKGVYSERGSALNSVLSKNPECLICSDAVLQLIKNRVPLDKTITESKDIRRFVTVRNVKGGAMKRYNKHVPQHSSKAELIKMAGFYTAEGNTYRHPKYGENLANLDENSAYKAAQEMLAAYDSCIYLGKVVRFYYAKGETGTINYVLSGNKVPNSDGAKPLMDLPEEFPQDINYDWYIKEAAKMLYEIGYFKKISTASLF